METFEGDAVLAHHAGEGAPFVHHVVGLRRLFGLVLRGHGQGQQRRREEERENAAAVGVHACRTDAAATLLARPSQWLPWRSRAGAEGTRKNLPMRTWKRSPSSRSK